MSIIFIQAVSKNQNSREIVKLEAVREWLGGRSQATRLTQPRLEGNVYCKVLKNNHTGYQLLLYIFAIDFDCVNIYICGLLRDSGQSLFA
jgi:hypothetical protein